MCQKFEKIVFDVELRWEIPPENQDYSYPFSPEMIEFKLEFDKSTGVNIGFFRRLKELLDRRHGNLMKTWSLVQSVCSWLDSPLWFEWMASFYEEKVLRLTEDSARHLMLKALIDKDKQGEDDESLHGTDTKMKKLLEKARIEGRWGEGTFPCPVCGMHWLTEKEAEKCCKPAFVDR